VSDEVSNYQEEFQYLDELRQSAETNMFGAGPYITAMFGHDKKEAREICRKWAKQFNPGGGS